MKTCRKNHQYEGSRKRCPECERMWKDLNKERIAMKNRAWYQTNKERVADYQNNRREANPEYFRNYREANKDKLIEYQRKYQQKYYINNKEHINVISRKWREANKQHKLNYQREYRRQRRINDPLYKLRQNTSSLIANSFANRGWKKSSKTQLILGCDFKTLEAHLIQTAKTNYAGKYFPGRKYEIDHFKPVTQATTEEDLMKLNHYTNLQYLLKQHNRAKSDDLGWVIPDVFR